MGLSTWWQTRQVDSPLPQAAHYGFYFTKWPPKFAAIQANCSVYPQLYWSKYKPDVTCRPAGVCFLPTSARQHSRVLSRLSRQHRPSRAACGCILPRFCRWALLVNHAVKASRPGRAHARLIAICRDLSPDVRSLSAKMESSHADSVTEGEVDDAKFAPAGAE